MLKVRPCWIMPGSADSCCATVWSRSTRPQGAQWWENLKEFSEDDLITVQKDVKPQIEEIWSQHKPTMFWLEFISDYRFNFLFQTIHSRPCSISHAHACRMHINDQSEWDVVPNLVSLWNGRQQISGSALLRKSWTSSSTFHKSTRVPNTPEVRLCGCYRNPASNDSRKAMQTFLVNRSQSVTVLLRLPNGSLQASVNHHWP